MSEFVKSFKEGFSEAFNWKKNPASVFPFVIPLAVFGFGCHIMIAYLKWQETGTYAYAMIVGAALIVLAVALYPAIKMLNDLQKRQARWDAEDLARKQKL